MIVCSKCNKKLKDGTKFCSECGAPITTEKTVIEEAVLVKKNKKIFKLVGIIAAVLVVILLLSTVFGGASQSSYAIYIKDKELFYAKESNWKPWQITEEFVDTDSLENEDLAQISSSLGHYVAISEDGKTIFYIDKMDGSNGVSIYYRQVNKNKKPSKIASGVQSFEVNDKGNIVTYLRSDGGNLYQHNLKDKEKIASEVTNFVVSDDGKTIVYQNQDGDLYMKQAGKSQDKIAGGISSIEYVSEDFGTVYYLKENTLYKKEQQKDKVKIASDVQSVVHVYDTGEIYYLKAEMEKVKVSDYIEDDMKEQDEAMVEPVYPTYPSVSDYASYEEFQAAYKEYEIKYEQYEAARDAYYEKGYRDVLRQGLAEETLDHVRYELCYYNGSKEVVMTKDAIDCETYAEDKAAIIYSSCEDKKVTKVNLSEIDSMYDVQTYIMESMKSSGEYYLAVGKKTSKIEQETVYSFDMDASGKTIYMMAGVSEDDQAGTLYKIKVSGNKAGKPKEVDEDVYLDHRFVQGDSYVYYKDVNESGISGDLCIDGKNVDCDVKVGSVAYKEGNFAYMVEWDGDDQCGTLRKYNGKKAVTLSDEVATFTFLPSGEIIYLYDYSTEKYRGELYICQGNKPKKIDEDVVAIIHPYDSHQ